MFNTLIFIIPSCIFAIPFLVPSGPHMIVWLLAAFSYSVYVFHKLLETEIMASLFFGLIFTLSPLAVKSFINDNGNTFSSDGDDYYYENDAYRR
jgi:hypothetical protein